MASQAAAVLGRKRWKGSTPEQRSAHAVVMNAGKRRSMTKKQISAQARSAANARMEESQGGGGQGVGESAGAGRRGARKSGSQEVRKGSREAEEAITFGLAGSSGVL
jgi:hypothetical protein